jgi:hypothetical protein
MEPQGLSLAVQPPVKIHRLTAAAERMGVSFTDAASVGSSWCLLGPSCARGR